MLREEGLILFISTAEEFNQTHHTGQQVQLLAKVIVLCEEWVEEHSAGLTRIGVESGQYREISMDEFATYRAIVRMHNAAVLTLKGGVFNPQLGQGMSAYLPERISRVVWEYRGVPF